MTNIKPKKNSLRPAIICSVEKNENPRAQLCIHTLSRVKPRPIYSLCIDPKLAVVVKRTGIEQVAAIFFYTLFSRLASSRSVAAHCQSMVIQ